MDVNIALREKDFRATFSVEQVDEKTFTIRLKKYDGDQKPPLYIKLIKTNNGWSSAFHDTELVHDLGKAIDAG